MSHSLFSVPRNRLLLPFLQRQQQQQQQTQRLLQHQHSRAPERFSHFQSKQSYSSKMLKQQNARVAASQNRPNKNVFCLSTIADPYIPAVYKSQHQTSLFSVTAWKERVLKFYDKWSTFAMLWRRLGRTQVGRRNEREIAIQVYTDVMQALHKKDLGKLRHVCTERVAADMKGEVRKRPDMEEWELRAVKKFKYVHGFKGNRKLRAINKNVMFIQVLYRCILLYMKMMMMMLMFMSPTSFFAFVQTYFFFVQRTYQIVSDQLVKNVRKGTEEVFENVEDYIVLERNLLDPMGTWKYAGKSKCPGNLLLLFCSRRGCRMHFVDPFPCCYSRYFQAIHTAIPASDYPEYGRTDESQSLRTDRRPIDDRMFLNDSNNSSLIPFFSTIIITRIGCLRNVGRTTLQCIIRYLDVIHYHLLLHHTNYCVITHLRSCLKMINVIISPRRVSKSRPQQPDSQQQHLSVHNIKRKWWKRRLQEGLKRTLPGGARVSRSKLTSRKSSSLVRVQ